LRRTDTTGKQNLWISGPSSNPSAKPVEGEYLNQISEAWTRYIEEATGEAVTVFDERDPDTIRDLRFVKD
jgi:hypothetical protein